MTDVHPDQDLLIDLALSDIDQQQRDEVVRHLALCDPCRRDYAAIADGVDHALAAAPWVAPPPGFSRSVLAAMGMAPERCTGRMPPTGPPPRTRCPTPLPAPRGCATARAAGSS